MLRTRAEVDLHVQKTLAALKTSKEKKLRGYSIARLYFEIGDYQTCVQYATKYLSVKSDNAACRNLLGQAYAKLGRPDGALEQYRLSLDLDPNQDNLVLKVCELLGADANVDAGVVRYWVDRAAVIFPNHPTVFRLSHRRLQMEKADPAAYADLLRKQAAARPSDPTSHSRLVRQLIQSDRAEEAYRHALNLLQADGLKFRESLLWQESVIEAAAAQKSGIGKASQTSEYWTTYLTALERKALLQLEWKYSCAEAAEAIRELDVVLSEASHCEKSDSELITSFAISLCFLAGTLLLKKASSDRSGWRRAVDHSAPLFLLAYHLFSDVQIRTAITAHCKSQAGHTLIAFARSKRGTFLDGVLPFCTGKDWRQKLYTVLFLNKNPSLKGPPSFLLESALLEEPKLKMPVLEELYEFDLAAMAYLPDSLHNQMWLGMNLEKLFKMRSKIDTLPFSIDNLSNCAAETLGNLDMDAFLYCAIIITVYNSKTNKKAEVPDRPAVIPAVLTDSLCTTEQSKWWECAWQMIRNESGQDTDVRVVVQRGIECIRCAVNHGLDSYILGRLGRAFSERAEEEKPQRQALIKRAALYYSTALPLLEKSKVSIGENLKKRLFNFTTKSNEIDHNLLEECKLFLGKYYMDILDPDRAIELLGNVKSPYGSFYLHKIYMNLANKQLGYLSNSDAAPQHRTNLLSKARDYIYLTSSRLKDCNSEHPLFEMLSECIENVERALSLVALDNSFSKNNTATEYFSDEQSLTGDIEPNESTTKLNDVSISSNLRSLEAQVWQLQRKENAITSLLDQIGPLLESNKVLTEEVRDFKIVLEDIKKQNMTSVDKRKFFSSLDQIQGKVDDLHEESVSKIADLKKDIVDLRIEFGKLKLSSNSQPRQHEDDLYLAEEAYRPQANLPRLPNNPPVIPPHPYSMYGHPGLHPFYPGQYPALPQLFPAHLLQPDQSLYPELLMQGGAQSMHIPSLIDVQNALQNQLATSNISPQVVQSVAVSTQPPIVPPAQPTVSQGANFPQAHEYQIPLPANVPSVPQFLFNQQTSTPNKSVDSSNPVAPFKSFGLFDNQKPTAGTAASDVPSSLSIFNTSSLSDSLPAESLNIVKNRSVSEKSEDGYDPCPDFKPVIPLPDEVVPTTGEENETVLFNARAKLYRFVSEEWKERGLGQLKLLKDNNNGKVRLLMRRETVHTICANHLITPEMELSPMKGADKAFFWVANDFADETVKLEKLCVKFKTLDIAKNFQNMFNSSKDSLKNSNNKENMSSTVIKESQITTKSKPHENTWKCSDCSTMNDGALEKCRICETSSNKSKTAPLTVGGLTFTMPPAIKTVQETKVSSVTTTETAKPNPFASFSFSKSASTMSATAPVVTADVKGEKINPTAEPVQSGWGDKFKPKPGSWSCTACYLNNDASNDYCVSCDNPKVPGMPKKDKPVANFGGSQQFKFGISAPTTDVPKFGISAPTSSTDVPKFGIAAPTVSTDVPKFGVAAPVATPPTFKFGLNLASKPDTVVPSDDKNKKPDANTSKDDKVCTFGSMKNEKYEFAFTPKAVVKSPNKSCDDGANDDSEYAQEDDGHHIFFEPLIPLPDKVEVKTGEEDETLLYSHRAKLYRFAEAEWKECGVGDVKILQNNLSKKIRILMRREPILKVCLNHALTLDVDYTVKDEKTWLFSANDFSTEEICLQQFCIRFGNKNVANEFKDAVDNAKNIIRGVKETETGDVSVIEKSLNSVNLSKTNDDIQFISETIVSNDEIKQAQKLKLPDKFYAYKQRPDCPGCIGCSLYENYDKEILKEKKIKPQKKLSFSNQPKFGQGMTNIQKDSSKNPSEKKESIFGSNLMASTTTTPSIFGGVSNINSGISLTSTFSQSPAFGSKPIFGGGIFGSNSFKPSDTPEKSIFGGSSENKTPQFSLQNMFSSDPSKNSSPFNFSFIKSNTSEVKDVQKSFNNDENDAEGHPEEEKDIFFKPVIPLPDEVEVKTGEEDETVLYSHRAKLYRFAESEWKECGVGDVKILSSNKTKKLRVLMRRSPIMKICLNHWLTDDIEYLPKDEKSWLFQACDFSTEEVLPQQFSIRFANKDVAIEFKKAVENALGSLKTSQEKESTKNENSLFADSATSDVGNTGVFRGLLAPKFVVPEKAADEDTVQKTTNTVDTSKSIFGGTAAKTTESAFGTVTGKVPESIFGGNAVKTAEIGFGASTGKSIFGANVAKTPEIGFGGTKTDSIFGAKPFTLGGLKPTDLTNESTKNVPVFGSSSTTVKEISFGSVSAGESNNYFSLAAEPGKNSSPNDSQSKENQSFKWAGAGTPLFKATSRGANDSKTNDGESADDSKTTDGVGADYDPHYEPIVPMPDEIVVVTGEEDEAVVFNSKGKLYRFTDKEWKERGLGDMKILHHPERGTYRMILRQHQVHKVVLNLLITHDLELLPLNDNRAYMWVGLNYTDDACGVMEKLAIKFRKSETADEFKSKVDAIQNGLETSVQNNSQSDTSYNQSLDSTGGNTSNSFNGELKS